jgi:hypothetical protein
VILVISGIENIDSMSFTPSITSKALESISESLLVGVHVSLTIDHDGRLLPNLFEDVEHVHERAP